MEKTPSLLKSKVGGFDRAGMCFDCGDEDKCVRRYGRVFVLFTIFLITFVPISTNIYIFIPWLKSTERNLWIWLAPYNAACLSIWINYYLGCITCAGNIPNNYAPQTLTRWCKACQRHKPPRTHHCSICKSCILKMDHHCKIYCLNLKVLG